MSEHLLFILRQKEIEAEKKGNKESCQHSKEAEQKNVDDYFDEIFKGCAQ